MRKQRQKPDLCHKVGPRARARVQILPNYKKMIQGSGAYMPLCIITPLCQGGANLLGWLGFHYQDDYSF